MDGCLRHAKVVGSTPIGSTKLLRCYPETWVTVDTGDMGNTFGAKGFPDDFLLPDGHADENSEGEHEAAEKTLVWVAQGAGPELRAAQLWRFAAVRTIEPAQLQGFGDVLLSRARLAGKDKNC